MVLNIFKKPYTLRRFEKSELIRGHIHAKYTDSTVMLNVQPLTTEEIMVLPEGMRKKKNIKAIGKVPIRTADEKEGTLADRIYYHGEWYECTGSDVWGNTPVGQTEAVFGLVPHEKGDIQFSSVANKGAEGGNSDGDGGDTS